MYDINIVQTAHRPHAWQTAAGSDKRQLSHKIRTLQSAHASDYSPTISEYSYLIKYVVYTNERVIFCYGRAAHNRT